MNLSGRISLFLVVLAGACRPAAVLSSQPQKEISQVAVPDTTRKSYRSLAEARLGKNPSCEKNKAGTMVLCQQVQHAPRPAMGNSVAWLVILLKDNSLVFEDRVANARVRWFNNTQLRIYLYAGTVRGIPPHQDQFYLFDLETKQKVMPASDKW